MYDDARRLTAPDASHSVTAAGKLVHRRCAVVPFLDSMKTRTRQSRLPFLVVAAVVVAMAAACGPPDDPEVVAIAYVRAVNTGDPDTAVELLDLQRVFERVDEQITIVNQQDADAFLRDSVETLLWGLFRQSVQGEYTYDARPAEVRGETATVVVTKVDAEGHTTETEVHLRRTGRGWKVSGESLDPLVTYVIQRLEERY